MHSQIKIGHDKTSIKSSTIHHRFSAINCVIKKAIKDKIINENPLQNIVVPEPKKAKKVYLTMEELNLIMSADCKDVELKRAFIWLYVVLSE